MIFLGLLLDLDERSNNAYVTTLSNILQRFELENRRKILTSPPQQFRFLSSPSITSEMRNVLKHLSSNLPRDIVPLWSASKKLKITKWTDCSPAADIVSSPPRSQPWINVWRNDDPHTPARNFKSLRSRSRSANHPLAPQSRSQPHVYSFDCGQQWCN